jgi:hypothetical protein
VSWKRKKEITLRDRRAGGGGEKGERKKGTGCREKWQEKEKEKGERRREKGERGKRKEERGIRRHPLLNAMILLL